MKTLTCFLSIILFTASCKKENVNTKKEVNNPDNIYGKWHWVSSSGGIAGLTETPKTAGYTMGVDYNRNNVFRRYKNGDVINSAKFTIVKTKGVFGMDSTYVIKYTPDNFDHVVITAKRDSLVLTDNISDGYTTLYIKDK
ncbi:MAG: hypothetical protein EOP47_25625 [Sphingobacteriaceae bacterium]|nr:MAG: hypothetical protein EOP47_25625 [Sphingobacteriaceae bacterium]